MKEQGDTDPSDRIVIYADPDLVDIIPWFLERKSEDARVMSEALDRGDYDTIGVVGHIMKGAGGSYGFDDLTDIGSAIEQGAIGRDAADIPRQLTRLLDYLERVEVAYE